MRLHCKDCGLTGSERSGDFIAVTVQSTISKGNVVAMRCSRCGGFHVERLERAKKERKG